VHSRVGGSLRGLADGPLGDGRSKTGCAFKGVKRRAQRKQRWPLLFEKRNKALETLEKLETARIDGRSFLGLS